MKSVKMFYRQGCPYCRAAFEALEDLKKEKPEFSQIPIEFIDENEKPEIADSYDYYYVPTVYVGERKSFEAGRRDTYESLKEKLDAALLDACGT